VVEVGQAIVANEVSLIAIMAILAALGALMTVTMAMANTRVQSTAPDALRGRVMSVYMTVFAGSTPFGALIAGAVANSFGATGSLILGGVVSVGAVALVALLYRRITASSERALHPGTAKLPG
jgi:predicted MFS family arabinose efflux permease